MNGNDTFLDVNDAHLRVTSGNVYASAFNLDQIDIVMSSNTASTVNFNNPTKAFNAASNIEVGTANLFVDTTTTRVGIGTASPDANLHVEGDAYVSSNLEVGNSVFPTWYQTIAGSSYESGHSIAVDSSGNVYVTGYYNSTSPVSLGNGLVLPSTYLDDVYIVKYDTSGTAQWYQTIAGRGSPSSRDGGRSIAVDSGGNVYVTGNYNSTTAVSLGNNLSLPFSYGSEAYIVKYDTSGTAQWYQTISGTSFDIGYGIAVDSSGNVYATGRYESSTTTVSLGNGLELPVSSTTDAYIVKYDTSGTAQWYQTIAGSSSDIAFGIAVDSSGSVYATGFYNSTTAVSLGNNLSLPVSSGDDVFIVKYDTSGTAQWYQTISGTSNHTGYGIAVDSGGNVYATGYYNSTTIVSLGNNINLPVSSGNDVFIVKYDTSGTAQWYQTISGTSNNRGYGIAVDSGGNVYATGRYESSTSPVSLGNNINLPVSSTTDAYIVKYNSSGTAQWYQTISGTSSDVGYGIAVDSGGNVYATGYYNSTTTVSLGNGLELPVSSTTDAYIVKYSPNPILFIDATTTRVGVGTASPATTLDVNGTISGNGSGLTALNATNITTGTLDRNTTGSAATLTTPRSIGGVNFDGSADIVPTTFGAATFDTDTLVVDSVNNRVGIGTTSPSSQLELYGAGKDLTFKYDTGISRQTPGTRDTYYSGLENSIKRVGDRNVFDGSLFTPDTTHEILMGFSDTYTQYSNSGYYYPSYNEMRFKLWSPTSSTVGSLTDVLTLRGDGNVGIGTTNPASKLEVLGTNSAHNTTIYPLTVTTISSSSTAVEEGIGTGIEFRVERQDTDNIQGECGAIRVYGAAGIPSTSDYWNMAFRVKSNDTIFEPMTLMYNGNVGIGTTSPDDKFHLYGATDSTLRVETDTGQAQLLLRSGATTRRACRIDFSRADTGTQYMQLISDYQQNGTDDLTVATSTSGRIMTWLQNGNVGINQTSPDSKLHIKPNHTSYSNPTATSGLAIYNETNSDPSITHSILSLRTGGTSGGDPFVSYDVAGEHGWSIGIDNSAGRQLRFGQSWANFTSTKAFISQNSTAQEIDFTGQHRSFIDTIAHTDYLKYEGLIVSANKNQYFDIQEEIVTGVQAIKINESLPLVSISNVAYDKCCFGVISGSEDTNDREYSQGSFVSVLKKQDGDIRAHVNSVGEGAIWVVNTNGILESGDYITTSNVAGYGQKQDSEFLANYTVAKITMDCDFNPSTQPTRIIKRELRDVNYWVKYTYDDISEEEYTRVTNLGRRVRIIESGTEISQEEYENHLKKEGYTETENNTYIRNETTHQRVFSDKKMEPTDGFNLEVRNEPVNVLDEHGQIQWEDDPSGATEKAYKIRYLDAGGNITDEANAVHIAAFVGCTYHCG